MKGKYENPKQEKHGPKKIIVIFMIAFFVLIISAVASAAVYYNTMLNNLSIGNIPNPVDSVPAADSIPPQTLPTAL